MTMGHLPLSSLSFSLLLRAPTTARVLGKSVESVRKAPIALILAHSLDSHLSLGHYSHLRLFQIRRRGISLRIKNKTKKNLDFLPILEIIKKKECHGRAVINNPLLCF